MLHRNGNPALEARLMTASDWLQRMNRNDVPDDELQAWLEWA